ncbi:MAG: type I-B CRISPR-associated protein Cas7/Cst2/DevR [Chloroflexota bacterium]|nr:type I-B CRISPR-associated protein Cas7/Cst2/DevR [Chloroflexota bacterium]
MRDDVKAIQVVWLSRTGLTNLNSGEGGSNLVDIKKYRFAGQEYPYVSGQAMRFYLKEALRRHLQPEEACVADEQGENCGRIAQCVLCDLFGFMWTERGERRGEGRSHVRVSPVKLSPAMGLLPLDMTLTVDFLTRRPRGTTVEAGDQEEARSIVNVELAVNIYKAGLCVDMQRIGREEEVTELLKAESTRRRYPIRSVELKSYIDDAERARRIGILLDALQDFSDYSKQARLLTDFTPDVVLVSLQHNYSHRLQKALETDSSGNVNVGRLVQVLDEVKPDCLTADGRPAIWAGVLDGSVSNVDAVSAALQQAGVPVSTPRQAIQAAKAALAV